MNPKKSFEPLLLLARALYCAAALLGMLSVMAIFSESPAPAWMVATAAAVLAASARQIHAAWRDTRAVEAGLFPWLRQFL